MDLQSFLIGYFVGAFFLVLKYCVAHAVYKIIERIKERRLDKLLERQRNE